MYENLRKVRDEALQCQKCALAGTRRHVVFGEGSLHARLMFVGEGPGATEDATGRPFVGPAGQLLERMLGAIGLTRDEVYIANIVKCRPPGNADPRPEYAEACLPYLREQVLKYFPRNQKETGTAMNSGEVAEAPTVADASDASGISGVSDVPAEKA